MPRFLISFFGSLALIGSGWVFAESDTATLESVIAKYRADVLLASGGSVETSPLFMSQAERRIAFAHFDVLFPTRVIRSSGEASPLPSAPVDLSSVRFTVNETDMALSELLDSEHLMGLLVVQDGKVLMEHYAADHGADVPWVTFSVTKSVTSLLIGAAIHDGYIDSVADPIVKYLPRLAGSEYGESRVQDILQMASGITWNEDYEDPDVLAGYILAEQLRSEQQDSLQTLLSFVGTLNVFRLLTTGKLPEATLTNYAQSLLLTDPHRIDYTDLKTRFAAKGISPIPYAYAVDLTGEQTADLIDHGQTEQFKPSLQDAYWVRLQSLCGG